MKINNSTLLRNSKVSLLVRITMVIALMIALTSAGRNESRMPIPMEWKQSGYDFKVPKYFSNGKEYFYEDGPYSFVIYKHKNAEISYCSLMGAWACDDDEFPSRNHAISNNVFIKSIAYKSANGVFSGYTTDGRIYYMKKKQNVNNLDPDAELSICHASYLAVIYPKSRQKEMSPVIDMISKW